MTKKIRQAYDKDFYAWALNNAELLRKRKLSEIDIDNIAEEIESMGKSEKRELINRLIILMAHLLKWKLQQPRRSTSWELTIKNQRAQLMDLLEDSPSLKNELEETFRKAYQRAISVAAEQTGIEEEKFPKKAPFTLKECLTSNYFPE